MAQGGNEPVEPFEAVGEEAEGFSESVGNGIGGRLILTVFPFMVLILLLLLEWWIRGRS